MFFDERSRRSRDDSKKYGPTTSRWQDLIHPRERSDVIEHLTAAGWDVSTVPMREAHLSNGFEPPDDEMSAIFANLSYLSATLVA